MYVSIAGLEGVENDVFRDICGPRTSFSRCEFVRRVLVLAFGRPEE